jgi:hypothetical protein
MALQNINYTELFPALGKFITEKKLQDVCVMEFEDGIIVAGSVLFDRRGGVGRAQETFVLSAEDLEKLTGNRGAFKG